MDFQSCQVVIPLDGLCYKMGQSIHQFYKKLFHMSQNVYHATDEIKAMSTQVVL